MALYATLDDVAVRRPGGIPDEMTDRATAALEDACVVIDDAIGKSFTGPDDSTMPPFVRIIAIRLALRMLSNPNSLNYEQLGQRAARRPDEIAIAAGLLTKDERRQLRGACGLSDARTVHVPVGTTSTDLSYETPIGYGYYSPQPQEGDW